MRVTNSMPEDVQPHKRIDAVLPAGGRIGGAFADVTGVGIKALMEIDGQTILRRTIDVLRATGRIGRIVVVGPEQALSEARECGADAAVEEGATGPENNFRGLEWLQQNRDGCSSRVVIATTDLPFLTPGAIIRFLNSCPPDADLVVPIMTSAAFEARFPDSINQYVRLRDGEFTIGCVFLVNPSTLLSNKAHIEQVFEARKSQWQMAKLVGLPVALRFLSRQLTIEHIIDRVSTILRCRGAAITDAPPELAFDIDHLSEYEYVRSTVARCTEREKAAL